jgi:nucleoid-associated protein YgaU
MAETTANVLAGLGLTVAPTAPQPQDDPMRDMTANVLSGIGQFTGKQVNAGGGAPAPHTSLEMLVVQALQQGQSDAYIDTIVNEAAKAGTITIPQGLATANGTVDTAVLLYSLIEKARAAAGEPPLPPTGANTDIALTSDQDADQRFYTVGTGDSLGAIAVKFYGSVEKYDLNYQANRKVLSSPNAIQVGQRLAIPEVAG